MKLLVLSDLHLEFGPLELDAERCGAADVIVLAGDTDILLRGIAWADQLSRRLKDKPVITVTESTMRARGIINFLTLDNHVRFDIDEAAAEKNGVHISSKLLGLAHNVTQKSAAP